MRRPPFIRFLSWKEKEKDRLQQADIKLSFEREPFRSSLTKGSRSKRHDQLLNSLPWPIYVINSFDST